MRGFKCSNVQIIKKKKSLNWFTVDSGITFAFTSWVPPASVAIDFTTECRVRVTNKP